MIWGCTFLASLFFLGLDVYHWATTGKWDATTLATALGIPRSQVFFQKWAVLDEVVRYIVCEAHVWLLLMGIAFVLLNFKVAGEQRG
jgi:hypothetical protein